LTRIVASSVGGLVLTVTEACQFSCDPSVPSRPPLVLPPFNAPRSAGNLPVPGPSSRRLPAPLHDLGPAEQDGGSCRTLREPLLAGQFYRGFGVLTRLLRLLPKLMESSHAEEGRRQAR
jgi:hypothetical protein